MKNVFAMSFVLILLFTSCGSNPEPQEDGSITMTSDLQWDSFAEIEFMDRAIEKLSLYQQQWALAAEIDKDQILDSIIRTNDFAGSYSSFANLVTWRDGIRSADIFWSVLFDDQGNYSMRRENGDILDIWIKYGQALKIFSGLWLETELQESPLDESTQSRRGQGFTALLTEQPKESLQWLVLEDGIHGGLFFETQGIDSLGLFPDNEDWQYSAYYIYHLESHELVYTYVGIVTPPSEPDYSYSQVFWNYNEAMDLTFPESMEEF